MKYTVLGAAVLALGLAGCGGGDAEAPSATPVAQTPAAPVAQTPAAPALQSTGSVSANFVVGALSPKATILQLSGQTFSTVKQVIQKDGAVTTLGDYVFSDPSPVTQDIAGDATFAMGRWVRGTLTNTSPTTTTKPKTIDGTSSNDFIHYVVVNPLAAFPTTGSKTCNTGTFTTPSYIGGGTSSAPAFAKVVASNVSLSFGSAGASASLSLNFSAGTATATNTYNPLVSGPNALVGLGNSIGSNGPGGTIGLGDAGNGAVRLSGYYQTLLSDGSRYQGVYSFLCH